MRSLSKRAEPRVRDSLPYFPRLLTSSPTNSLPRSADPRSGVVGWRNEPGRRPALQGRQFKEPTRELRVERSIARTRVAAHGHAPHPFRNERTHARHAQQQHQRSRRFQLVRQQPHRDIAHQQHREHKGEHRFV